MIRIYNECLFKKNHIIDKFYLLTANTNLVRASEVLADVLGSLGMT